MWKIYVSYVSWIICSSYLMTLDYMVGIFELYDISCSEIAQVWSDEMMYWLLVEYIEIYVKDKEIPHCIIWNDEMCAQLVVIVQP